MTKTRSVPGLARDHSHTGPITKMTIKTLTLSAGVFFALAGAAQAACEVTLAGDIQPVLDMRCVGCHQDAAPGAGLSLQSGSTISNTVGVPSTQVSDMNRIEPGDTQLSYLYHKLAGTHGDVGGSGERMPFGGQLTDDEMAMIANWIEDCEAAE